jgi:YjbE family integral membrane protein
METVEFGQPQFWLSLLQIIWIDLLLAGDNALVIGLACRNLQARNRFWGIILGAGAAILLRITFTGLAATLMTLPYVMLIGGVALFVIAIKLLTDEGGADHSGIQPQQDLWGAVKLIAVADVVMSLDNVIAVAAASRGSYALLMIGLALSIPLVVAGASIVTAILVRMPILVWAGAALLGWIAGEIIMKDPLLRGFQTEYLSAAMAEQVHLTSAGVGAAFVVLAGLGLRRLRRAKAEVRVG